MGIAEQDAKLQCKHYKLYDDWINSVYDPVKEGVSQGVETEFGALRQDRLHQYDKYLKTSNERRFHSFLHCI